MSSNEEYTIRESQKSELSIIASLIDDYINDETLYQSFLKKNKRKFPEKEKTLRETINNLITNTINNYPSLVVIHEPSQKIVGHLILRIVENPLLTADNSVSLPSISPETPEAIVTLFKYFDKIAAGKETFERYPDAKKLLRIIMLGVRKEHRKKGLAKRLLREGVDWAMEKGFELAQGTFSSAFSKRTAESVGFRTLWEFDMRDCRNERGEAVFVDAGVNNIIATMVLELKD